MMSKPEKGIWETTQVQNLVRYKPSGTYFARFRVNGKLLWKTLETTVFSVAKQRLPETIRECRSAGESSKALKTGRITFSEAADAYLERVQASVSLKPRSKEYRHLMVGTIRKTWPALFETDVRKVSVRDCEEWLSKFQRRYAPSVINNAIGTMRGVFDIAVKAGARFNNPADELSRVRERPKRLQLPSRAEFVRFVEEIRTAGARQSKDCANLVCLLAYSGMRVGEAKFLTWGDVNFKRMEIHVQGDPVTATKNGETRYVPMIPELESLLKRMRETRPDEPPTAIVPGVFECQNAMTHAAQRVGMKRITHHDLRHLFATICIESGVDIPTVSRWLGHKDGGTLCMRTYGHLRQDHSFAQAKRVSFGV